MKKIAYIVPGLGISGGIAIILQHANRLIERGYSVTLINLGPPVQSINWFFCRAHILNASEEDIPKDVDIAVATHFSTTDFVWEHFSCRKMYFVQSDERRFGMSEPEIFSQCQRSYEYEMEYMTEAIWIQRWLKEEFGHDAYYVPNGLDSELTYEVAPLEPKTSRPRIMIEGPIAVPFKGMQDAYDAIKDLDGERWIISSYGKPGKDWKYDKFFEGVPFEKMKEMYSSCDIFLKMSRVEGFFGPPLEAMACGCAVVVGKVTGYDEYIQDGYNALVVEQGDVEGAKKAVSRLMNDEGLRKSLIENGKKTAVEWGWDRSIDYLEKAFHKENPKPMYTDAFPEKYDYQKAMFPIMREIVETCGDVEVVSLKDRIEELEKEIEEKKKQIIFMENSKFWRYRTLYLKWKKKLTFDSK